MPESPQRLDATIRTLERDVAWLEGWLRGDRTRKGLKQFYGHQSWIDDTEHGKLVSATRETVDSHHRYLERLQAEQRTSSRAA